MTIQEQIKELEDKLNELKEQVKNGQVWKPKKGENYYVILDNTCLVCESVWNNDSYDKNRYAIGNCFKTKQEVEDTVKALKKGTIYCLNENFCDVAIQEIGEEDLKWYLMR